MKEKRYIKAIILLIIITFTGVVIYFAGHLYLYCKALSNSNGPSSIGIIGSADGTTTILVAGTNSFQYIVLILISLSIIGIIYLIFIRKRQK